MVSKIAEENWWVMGVGKSPDSAGWIGRGERELVRFIEKEMGGLDEEGKLALVFTSLFLKGGHTSLPLDQTPQQWGKILGLEPSVTEALPDRLIDPERLKSQNLAGNSEEETLLTVHGDRLSIRKYYTLENKLLQWVTDSNEINYCFDISKYISEIFPETAENEVNWQKIASVMSLLRKLLILSGGPGTGKTTTVARMLLLNRLLEEHPLRIALTAPTGKAAGRMGEALRDEFERMGPLLKQYGLSRDSFPAEAGTLHRLLYSGNRGALLPPLRKELLPYDLIIVDEASMMDLELVSLLISRLAPRARLILMGDKDQLSSVEAGSVFADLCRKQQNSFSPELGKALKTAGIEDPLPLKTQSALDDSIVYLTKSYRFDEKSGIGQLASGVRSGRVNGDALQQLFSTCEDLQLNSFTFTGEQLGNLTRQISDRVREATRMQDPKELFRLWKESVWLTPRRSGPAGTERLNRLLESSVMADVRPRGGGEWYHGRPVIITQNDYSAGVYNGDLGVCIAEGEEFRIWVESVSGPRKLRPERIRAYDPFYFLTVHKSQGSEFEEVNLLLPPNDHPLVTRELIYTAVTRARKRFNLYGSLDLFEAGIQRKTERYTGLKG